MNIYIYNTLTGHKDIQPIEGHNIVIGRFDASADPTDKTKISLPSRLVSRKHATLAYIKDQWFIEPVGVNETYLNDNLIPNGTPTALDLEDDLKVGEFIVRLSDASDLVEPGQVVREEGRLELLMAIEQDVHNRLLELMDLRRDDQELNLEDEKVRIKVTDDIEFLLDDLKQRLTRIEWHKLAEIGLYDRLNREILFGNSLVDPTKSSHASSPYESIVSGIVRRMKADLALVLGDKTLAEDMKKLDAGFTEVAKKYELEFSESVSMFVAESLIRKDLHNFVFGFGPLQDLLNFEDISEIMVVARDQIFIEKNGIVEDARRAFFSDEMLMAVIERIVAPIGRRIDRSSPIVDARLPDGSRVNAVIAPVAIKGPCLTIRKFKSVPIEMEDLIRFGALTEEVNTFLKACVGAHKNIVVSGGTGSGKTTLLNCLSQYVSPKERVVTIEDTAELQLKQPHVVTLEGRPANSEGKGAITIQDLVKNALRMRPDRLIVGECRGAEALDMLQAMNTGHDGSMTTGHANTPLDMMLRLETMVLMGTSMPVSAIREQIRAAVHIVVQLNRFPDGARRVTRVSEVTGIDETLGNITVADIYEYVPGRGGEFGMGKNKHTGYIPTFMDELLFKNLIDLDKFC